MKTKESSDSIDLIEEKSKQAKNSHYNKLSSTAEAIENLRKLSDSIRIKIQ